MQQVTQLSEMQHRTILMIGCGWEQEAIAKQIKDRGYRLIATHPDDSPEALSLADKFFVLSADDIGAHAKLVDTYSVDGVVTDNCDYSLYTAAHLRTEFDMSSADMRSALIANDKARQRRLVEQARVNQPERFVVTDVDEFREAVGTLGFPAIVKPVDSRGTLGVTVLSEQTGSDQAFLHALVYSPSRRAIVEQFIEGVLATVDGFCFADGHQSLTCASRRFTAGSAPVTKEIIYPAAFDDKTTKTLYDAHGSVVNELGYRFGHTHGEYLVQPNGSVFLVECTNRGAGVYTSSVINPLLTGIDLNSILIDQALGADQSHGPTDVGCMDCSLALTFEDYVPGRVVKHVNETAVWEVPGVVRFRSLYHDNELVAPTADCPTRHAIAILSANSSSELSERLVKLRSLDLVDYHEA